MDTIGDFSTGQNDVIDIANILDGFYDDATDNGTDSTLAIDQDGTAKGTKFLNVATIKGVIGLTDEAALESSGP